MKSPDISYQNGFALLVFVVALMGIGGIVLVGYSEAVLQEVETKKYKHNERVLKEAKQALLQFAYNYPATNGNGPGRLPCPDTNNDGTQNTPFGCSADLGRLPWNQPNLNLYDIRDADGQRLWYAVSENFSTLDAGDVNSDTKGNITVRDPSGNIIFDGSANDGVAAVIIAPGAITARNGVTQDRSVIDDNPFDTVADDDPGVILAANYLDLVVGTEDNANFSQNSAADGFILGPVNSQDANAVNDQIIVITAAEVIEVAEKAVLQAYRNTINDYRDNVVGNGYPWLYNYTGVTDVAGLSSIFPAEPNFNDELNTYLTNIGRIPSLFSDYFTDADSEPFDTDFNMVTRVTYPITPTTVGYNRTSPSAGAGTYRFNNNGVQYFFTADDFLTDAEFSELDGGGNLGRFSGDITSGQITSFETYFWDYDHGTTGIWSVCPPDDDFIPEITDCHRNDDDDPDPGGNHDIDLEILRVVIKLEYAAGDLLNFDTDYSDPPAIAYPIAPSGASHAEISAWFQDPGDLRLESLPITVEYFHTEHYHPGDSLPITYESSGNLNTTDLLGEALLQVRYFPELPDWAFDNGWHNSVMMAYAFDHRPDQLATCAAGVDCIQVGGLAGVNDDKVSILTLAGQHDWSNSGGSDLSDDIGSVFDLPNADIFDVDGTEYMFDKNVAGGNDVILVIECSPGPCL